MFHETITKAGIRLTHEIGATATMTLDRHTEKARDSHGTNYDKGTHFDYDRQAWVVNGCYVRCGHPEGMETCICYGRLHEGEPEITPHLIYNRHEHTHAHSFSRRPHRHEHGHTELEHGLRCHAHNRETAEADR